MQTGEFPHGKVHTKGSSYANWNSYENPIYIDRICTPLCCQNVFIICRMKSNPRFRCPEFSKGGKKYELKTGSAEIIPLWFWKRAKSCPAWQQMTSFFLHRIELILVFPTVLSFWSAKYTESINTEVKNLNTQLSPTPFNSDLPATPSCSIFPPVWPRF